MSVERMAQTIVAPITAIGGAVAIVRLSGPRAWETASKVFGAWPDPVVPRAVTYGQFSNGDDGFILPFAAERSYTGEESVEMTIHGSPASVSSLVRACLDAGAREAEPGEFTLRAFLNGRIDLTEAEGVKDTVAALTDGQLRQASAMRSGELGQTVSKVRDLLVSALAAVEASTDFSEEVGGVNTALVVSYCDSAVGEIARLLEGAGQSRLVRDGLRVAIVGLPNAGKSSLFNALVGADRAIVTHVPGTTRDTIEECVSWSGRLVRLTDTAGIRETDDEIEALGVERSVSALAEADLVLYVFDSHAGWTRDDEELIAKIKAPIILVANKSDLGGDSSRGLPVSATQATGIQNLIDAALGEFALDTSACPMINARHVPLLERARCSIERARQTFVTPVPDDLAAVDLRAAIRAMGEITGETADPDVIERVFSDFCIGK